MSQILIDYICKHISVMDDIVKRLHVILNHYELSASAFADKIKVQRSSISHLLNGRNKPSLEFVLKVIENFSAVDFYWLVYGKGTFPKTDRSLSDSSPTFIEPKESAPIQPTASSKNTIERIVVFYKNGTFKTYQQEETN
jgi:transcriptional regulator with XRE-family HTH domain